MVVVAAGCVGGDGHLLYMSQFLLSLSYKYHRYVYVPGTRKKDSALTRSLTSGSDSKTIAQRKMRSLQQTYVKKVRHLTILPRDPDRGGTLKPSKYIFFPVNPSRSLIPLVCFS